MASANGKSSEYTTDEMLCMDCEPECLGHKRVVFNRIRSGFAVTLAEAGAIAEQIFPDSPLDDIVIFVDEGHLCMEDAHPKDMPWKTRARKRKKKEEEKKDKSGDGAVKETEARAVDLPDPATLDDDLPRVLRGSNRAKID